MSLRDLLRQSRQTLAEFWSVRDARERVLLMVGAAVVLLGLCYALLVNPALSGRDRLNRNLPDLRQQAAELQALAKEAGSFSGKSAPLEVSVESIKSALARKGLMAQSVALNGDMLNVQLAEASFALTLEWLDEMQKMAGLAVVEANIVALAKPGMVNATLILRQQ